MVATLRHIAFSLMPAGLKWRYIYRRNRRNPAQAESASGPGSTLANTENVRQAMPDLLRRYSVTSIVDVPCGDFNWMRHIIAPASVERYVGLDIVPELIAENRQRYGSDRIEFAEFNVVASVLPAADLVLMRDLLIHFSFADTRRALRNVRQSDATWFLTTTYTEIAENHDIVTGRWRPINLEHSPYDFPPPLDLIVENEERGKSLGLWRVSDIPCGTYGSSSDLARP